MSKVIGEVFFYYINVFFMKMLNLIKIFCKVDYFGKKVKFSGYFCLSIYCNKC